MKLFNIILFYKLEGGSQIAALQFLNKSCMLIVLQHIYFLIEFQQYIYISYLISTEISHEFDLGKFVSLESCAVI